MPLINIPSDITHPAADIAIWIVDEAENVLLARLKLADTARAVLKNGMTLIGCSAPEKM